MTKHLLCGVDVSAKDFSVAIDPGRGASGRGSSATTRRGIESSSDD